MTAEWVKTSPWAWSLIMPGYGSAVAKAYENRDGDASWRAGHMIGPYAVGDSPSIGSGSDRFRAGSGTASDIGSPPLGGTGTDGAVGAMAWPEPIAGRPELPTRPPLRRYQGDVAGRVSTIDDAKRAASKAVADRIIAGLELMP